MARRLLADERRDGGWRPTELVQESYLRLLDWRACPLAESRALLCDRGEDDAARPRRRRARAAGASSVARASTRCRSTAWMLRRRRRPRRHGCTGRGARGARAGESEGEPDRRAAFLRRLQRRGDGRNAGRLGPNGDQRLEYRARMALSRAFEREGGRDERRALGPPVCVAQRLAGGRRPRARAACAPGWPRTTRSARRGRRARRGERCHLPGFLETPALVLAAPNLARRTRCSRPIRWSAPTAS